jgi:hypothetical protein
MQPALKIQTQRQQHLQIIYFSTVQCKGRENNREHGYLHAFGVPIQTKRCFLKTQTWFFNKGANTLTTPALPLILIIITLAHIYIILRS